MAWRTVVEAYQAAVRRELGHDFPEDPSDQLWGAIGAVFDSWMNDRAKFYRRMHSIPEAWGTAVNVQSMVFGNASVGQHPPASPSPDRRRGTACTAGTAINAQGEDVVAGIRTPQPLTTDARDETGDTPPSMQEAMPKVFGEFA